MIIPQIMAAMRIYSPPSLLKGTGRIEINNEDRLSA
jgi:hypothetical protein